MPYSGINDPQLPQYVQELDESKRKQWVAVFNEVHQETGDDGRAMASASAAVKSVNPTTEAEEKAWLETLEQLTPDKLSLMERFVKWFTGQPKQHYGFKVVGENQWVAWYTNAYQDKDYEFFPQVAIEADLDYMAQHNAYPELWFYHLPGTGHGKARWVGRVGKLAVAVGDFDESPLAQAFKNYYRTHKMELSHGFIYDAAQKKDGAFYAYHTYEISTLPPGKAANPYTAFDVKEMTMPQMSSDQFKALQEAVGLETALQIVQDGTAREKALQAANVAFKSVTDDGKGVTLEIETEPEAPETMEQEESAYTMKALCEKVDLLTKAMTDMAALMANKAVEPPPAPTPTPPQLSNERQRAIIADLQRNQEKSVDTRDTVSYMYSQIFGEES